MRLLNFALSTAAYGDTLIGLSFTDQIRRPGIEQHFVISEAAVPLVRSRGYDYTVLEPPGTRPAQEQIDACIRRFRPDAVVLADYLNYWGTLIRQYDTDPWFIESYGTTRLDARTGPSAAPAPGPLVGAGLPTPAGGPDAERGDAWPKGDPAMRLGGAGSGQSPNQRLRASRNDPSPVLAAAAARPAQAT
ncbi:DUF6365 family protein [Streptomyces tendae]|uniref:DUF6365 family protein n=1 Tax=Streptomyces tendae TaxID=1932 RepID=UPI0037100D9F